MVTPPPPKPKNTCRLLHSSLCYQNSMDLCRIAIVGHSFGGATVIKALSKEERFKYAS